MNMKIKMICGLTTGLMFLVTGLFPDLAKAAGCLNQHDKLNRRSLKHGNYDISRDTASTAKIQGAGKGASAKEKANKWEWLFDGTNTNKWRGVSSDKFPDDGWVIQNKTLSMAGKGGGDIITREKYDNFELLFEFNLTPLANSGLKYFVDSVENKHTGRKSINGPEYQIIDDHNHPEIKDQKHGKSSTAALYLVYAPQNKKLLPAGQWNQARIIANGKHVEHWLNGVKVVRYKKGSQDFRQRMATTKFKDYENYGEAAGGHILLTDHGDKVYFRNIKIKRL